MPEGLFVCVYHLDDISILAGALAYRAKTCWGSVRWTLGHLGWPQIHNETSNDNDQNSELSEHSLPRRIDPKKYNAWDGSRIEAQEAGFLEPGHAFASMSRSIWT